MYTQAQLQTFVAQLQQDGTDVHDVGEEHGLMLAYLDMGCAYSMGGNTWRAEGEQQQGEIYLGDEFVCEYSTDETTLRLHLENGFVKKYENNDTGWAQAARDSFECNDL
jgi:hypothetical protein